MAASFPLDLRLELLIGGTWTHVPTYERDTVQVETGIPDRASQTDPGSLSITVNNRDGAFSPRNPLSPHFGLIGRNTPARLSVPGTESYLELDGTADSASTPDDPALDITGDLDLRWEGEADWYAAGAQMLLGKWGESGQRSYHMRVQDGALYLSVIDSVGQSYFASRPLPALPRRAALRVTLDADNGAGGWSVSHYWAPSTAGPWTQIGTTLSAAGTVVMHVSTAPLTIAPEQPDTSPARHPVTGRCHRAEVRSGIDGLVVAAPDFTAQSAGTTGFVDSAGRTWTLSAAAAIRDRADLFSGEVSEWPQHWQPDESDAWVLLTASGILRRLGQGRKALASTLRRRIPSYAPLAYWPLEEGKAATQAYSPVDGVPPMLLTNVQWAAADSLAASSPLPTLGAQGDVPTMMAGTVPGGDGGSLPAWSVVWVYRLDQPNTALQTYMRVQSTGTVREWSIQSRDSQSRVIGKNAVGAEVFSTLIATSGDLFGQWMRVRFRVVQDGLTVRWRIDWTDVGGDAGGAGGSFTGTSGRPTAVASPPDGFSPDINGMALGHIAVFDTGDSAAFDGAIDAWTGETAWARMRRLATEENLPLARLPGPETTQRVGPQTPQTLLSLLQAAADADGGLLLEDRTRPGLLYRERSSLYTQQPALTLSYNQAPGLAAPLQPVDDDTAVRNDRTVQREGGSAARAVLETGPLSVQEPPDGIGVYDDSVTLSLHSDDQAEPIAHWRLRLGTVDAPRYPTVKLMLHKAPALIPAVLRLTEGDLIRITDLPLYVGAGDVDLIVTAIRHEAGLTRWDVTLTCDPGQPWNVAITDHPVYGYADTDGSELAADATATAATLQVQTTAGPEWVPESAPADIQLGGEVATVTAITQLGSGLAEFTVIRAVNGIAKPHPAGTAVSLHHAAITAL